MSFGVHFTVFWRLERDVPAQDESNVLRRTLYELSCAGRRCRGRGSALGLGTPYGRAGSRAAAAVRLDTLRKFELSAALVWVLRALELPRT